jgi:glycosyltransferase involved in cell wall biosynthesis
MRVLLNGWFWGQLAAGSGQYLGHLLPHLTAAAPHHEYLLAVWRQRPPSSEPPDCCVLSLATPFDRVSENLSKVWFEQVAYPLACRRLGADLAHVPHWGSPLQPAVPTVVTIHDLIPLLLPAYRGSRLVRLYTRLAAISARRAAGVITVSQASQRDIVTHLGLPERKVWITPEAAPAGFRRPGHTQVATVRRRYNLPDRFFLYLGGFDVRKNVGGVLKAFAQLGARGPLAAPHLVIAGRLPHTDTPFAPDPRRMARELRIDDRVVFTDWVDEADKPALYTAADVFVFPSYYEGFGLPVVEALACGTPIVTSNVSSLPEVAGPAGLLVSPSDVSELSAAMERLWQDAVLRERMREAALAQADRFSWQETARATADVYAQVLDGSRTG